MKLILEYDIDTDVIKQDVMTLTIIDDAKRMDQQQLADHVASVVAKTVNRVKRGIEMWQEPKEE